MSDRSITSYPELVDAIWDGVKGTVEDRERADFWKTERQVIEAIGLPPLPIDDARSEGVAYAVVDLVDQGYFRGRSRSNPVRWSAVSPSPDAPGELPSAHVLAQAITRKLLSLRARVLRHVSDRTLRNEGGIAFYVFSRTPYDDMIPVLFPNTEDTFQARGQIIQAINELIHLGFLQGVTTTGGFTGRVTLQGACWLTFGAPLLDLIDRAAKVPNHPEAIEAARIIREAHTRSEQDAARDLPVAIETLRNAVGGEQQLIALLGKPAPFVKDLMQSSQTHRHASTQATEKLDHVSVWPAPER